MFLILNQEITSGILRDTQFRRPWLWKSIYTPTYLPSGGEETFGVNIGVITLSVLVPHSSELLSYQWIGTKNRAVVTFSNHGGGANRILLYSSPFMLFYDPPPFVCWNRVLSRLTWLIHTSVLPSNWNLDLKSQFLALKWWWKLA